MGAVHTPTQAPLHFVEPYLDKSSDKLRAIYAGMVAALDEGLGNLTAALVKRGMLDDTVIVVTSDSGGPIDTCGAQGSNNGKLRAGKCALRRGYPCHWHCSHWLELCTAISRGQTLCTPHAWCRFAPHFGRRGRRRLGQQYYKHALGRHQPVEIFDYRGWRPCPHRSVLGPPQRFPKKQERCRC